MKAGGIVWQFELLRQQLASGRGQIAQFRRVHGGHDAGRPRLAGPRRQRPHRRRRSPLALALPFQAGKSDFLPSSLETNRDADPMRMHAMVLNPVLNPVWSYWVWRCDCFIGRIRILVRSAYRDRVRPVQATNRSSRCQRRRHPRRPRRGCAIRRRRRRLRWRPAAVLIRPISPSRRTGQRLPVSWSDAVSGFSSLRIFFFSKDRLGFCCKLMEILEDYRYIFVIPNMLGWD